MPKILIRLRQQAAKRRNQLHQSRLEQKALLTSKTVPSPSPKVDALPRLLQPKQSAPPKMPKENPWKKFKYGRSLFHLHDPPKN